jgi:hypothetical protein
MTKSTLERFMAKVEVTGGCWLWTAGQTGRDAKRGRGYGMFYFGNQRMLAHRWAWAHWRGEIPEGMQIDHLCKVKRCVNPDHLEVVTPAENMARQAATVPFQLRATHCPNGHAYEPDNAYVWGHTVRCRECRRLSDIRAREKDPKRYDAIRRAAKKRRLEKSLGGVSDSA